MGTDAEDANIHFVDGTPVMAVMNGIDAVLRGNTPDLVISGPNEGHNLGEMTNHSGTVGAAVMALKRGIPAIAVSADRDPRTSTPGDVAKLVVELVAQLEARQYGDSLLPEGMAINVNIPEMQDSEGNDVIQGIKYTHVADYSGYNPIFVDPMGPYIARIPASYFANEQDPTGEYTKAYVGSKPGIAFGSADALRDAETDPRAEGLWMEQGYIAISPMSGNYGGYGRWYLKFQLKGLTH